MKGEVKNPVKNLKSIQSAKKTNKKMQKEIIFIQKFKINKKYITDFNILYKDLLSNYIYNTAKD